MAVKLPNILTTPAPTLDGHVRTQSIVTDLCDLPLTDLKATADSDDPDELITVTDGVLDASDLDRLIDVSQITNLYTTASHTGTKPTANPVVEYWGVDAKGGMAMIKSVEYDLNAATLYSPDGGTTKMIPLDTAVQQIDCSAFRYVLPYHKTAGDVSDAITLIIKAT